MLAVPYISTFVSTYIISSKKIAVSPYVDSATPHTQPKRISLCISHILIQKKINAHFNSSKQKLH